MKTLLLLAVARLVALAAGGAVLHDERARRAIALRGGATASDIARHAGAGLMLADAIGSYAYPRKAIENSASASNDVPALVTARSEGQWRAGLAIMLLADGSDSRALVALSHYICAVNLLGDVPANDALGAPQAPIVALAAAFCVLGYGTSRGVVPRWVSPASCLLNGLQFYLTPKVAWAMYGADGKGASALALALTRRVGLGILLRGIYLGTILAGVSRKDALGAVFAAAALDALRRALSAEAALVGAPPRRAALLVGLPALIAAASFYGVSSSAL